MTIPLRIIKTGISSVEPKSLSRLAIPKNSQTVSTVRLTFVTIQVRKLYTFHPHIRKECSLLDIKHTNHRKILTQLGEPRF